MHSANPLSPVDPLETADTGQEAWADGSLGLVAASGGHCIEPKEPGTELGDESNCALYARDRVYTMDRRRLFDTRGFQQPVSGEPAFPLWNTVQNAGDSLSGTRGGDFLDVTRSEQCGDHVLLGNGLIMVESEASGAEQLYAGKAIDMPVGPTCEGRAVWPNARGEQGETLGWSITSWGADVAIGAPQVFGSRNGAIYLKPQHVPSWPPPEADDDCCFEWDTPEIRISGPPDVTDFGYALTALDADIDTGERGTLAIGAPGTNDDEGAVTLLPSQRPSTDAALQSLPHTTLMWSGARRFGVTLHAAQLDGHPADDLVIAADRRWYVVPGEVLASAPEGGVLDLATEPSVLELTTPAAWPDTTEAAGRLSCDGIAAGHLDEDEHVDLALGSCTSADGLGRVHVVTGPLGAGGASGRKTLESASAFVLVGASHHDFTGGSLTVLAEDPPNPDTTVLVVGAHGWDLAADDNRGAVILAHPGLFTEATWGLNCGF